MEADRTGIEKNVNMNLTGHLLFGPAEIKIKSENNTEVLTSARPES